MKTLNIAILNTDNVSEDDPNYIYNGPCFFGYLFKKWFEGCEHIKYEFRQFNSIKGELPPFPNDPIENSSRSNKFDLYVITGSKYGAYQRLEWIKNLEFWIQKADSIKLNLLGICFGHQIIAAALGGVVKLNPNGWELSTNIFELNSEGQKIFREKKEIKLLYTHQDAVIEIPSNFKSLGGNKNTQHQSLSYENYILTFQGHPEFSYENLHEILKKKHEEKVIDSIIYNEAVKKLYESNDSNYLLCASLRFFNLHE